MRLKRVTNKIFGNTASTTGSSDTGPEIGQFGSAKAGTYNATADVETIQALPAYEQGWIGAVIPDQQYPTLPEMTGVNKVLSYQTGYLMQEGIPEWDSGTTYYKNSIVKYATVTTTQTTTASIGASTGITSASVNKNTFVSQISVDGNYTFTYNGTSWLYNDIVTNLSIYGITYTGTPTENDAITVTLTTTTSIGDLALYKSLTDDNIGNNPTAENSIHWEVLNLGGAGWTPSLLQPFWSDHELDRMDMLRADTFSWQSGTTYSQAYNLLLEEYNNTASTEQTENGITFKITPKGFRIADSTQEQAILNLYNTTGVAWYYIIDPTNTRFKLPRMKYLASVNSKQAHIVAGTELTSLGNSLKFGTSTATSTEWFNIVQKPRTSDVRIAELLSGESVKPVEIDQSNLYADVSNAVTPQTLDNMYLYFYVGEYTQTAVEQTAGLNAELFNGKVDLNFNNMNPSQTAKNTIVGWGMPDYSGQISLPTGTTEQTYTAPSNGFIGYNFMMSGNNTGYVKVNDITVITNRPAGSNTYNSVSGIIPVNKNDVIKYWSNGTAKQYNNFQFYPMKGTN